MQGKKGERKEGRKQRRKEGRKLGIKWRRNKTNNEGSKQ